LDRSVWLERLVVVAVLLFVLWGIGSFGIWDPWELVQADAARALAENGPEAAAPTPLSTIAVGAAFRAFGIREWSGRLPGVVAGLLTCVLAFVLLRASHGRRAGTISVAVMASTPLFLLNSRLMMGASIGFFAQTWVGVASFAAFFSRGAPRRVVAAYGLLAIGVALSAYASGVLLGPLPPILAIAAWSLIATDDVVGRPIGRWLFPAAAVILAAGVVRAVAMDAPEPSIWLGGGAVGGNPPTHDKVLESIFHGFAPWSAALPIAGAWMLVPRPGRAGATQRLAWVLLLWSVFAFASSTVFASRYGTPPYLALVPLSGLVAIWMAELSREPVSRWPSAVVVTLLMGLLIRDYALYPDSPLRALPVDDLSVPEVYDPKRQWALLLFIAGALIASTLVSHEAIRRPRLGGTMQWLRAQWENGWGQRGWILVAALLLGACLGFGSMCLILDLRIASILVRVGRAAFFVPFVLAGLVFGLPWLHYAYGRLGTQRVVPPLAGGLAVGAFVALSFQPALSQHFSPRPVYETYSELTMGRAEPLALYQLPSTAARYYTNAPLEEIRDEAALIDFLLGGEQRWAVVEAKRLPELDRAYRRKSGEHLYVADGRSALLFLIAAKPIEGRASQSFIAKAMLKEAPTPQHPVGASYEDRIELLGYDLALPGGDFVGAGQRFEVTWYWRVLGKAPSGYQIFVHIDGQGLRINGDHEPVGGRYPTKLWETGDVIADSQELTVPANYRSGDYTIYVGFFAGSKRLEVKSGPNDGEDRVRAGTLPIR
jgi:hypothetical protein